METLDRDQVYKAIAGKAIERGLLVNEQGDSLLIQYEAPEQKEADHLHRQALRSMVQRFRKEGRINPKSQVRTLAVNNGFMVRVDEPSAEVVPTETEEVWAEETLGTDAEGAVTSDEIVAFLRKLLVS